MNRDFKGVWVPKEIWLNDHLTLQEKILLVEINSFEVCFASNAHFADFLNISERRIREILKSLKDKGFIETREERRGNFTAKRKIFVNKLKYYGAEGEAESRLGCGGIPPIGEAESRHRTNTSNTNTTNKDISTKTKKAQIDWSSCPNLQPSDISEIKTIRGKNKITQRVANSICSEINKSLQAGATLDNILTLWGEKGWRTYKHEWAINAVSQNNAPQNTQANQAGNGQWLDEMIQDGELDQYFDEGRL